MPIVFYEKEHAENLIKNGLERLNGTDLKYLAKYWDYLGCSETEIENNLIRFCSQNDPNFNEIQNYKFVHSATIHSRNNQLRFPTPIRITQSELDSIRSIENYKIEKLVFIMLLSAKFFKYHQSRKKSTKTDYDQYLYCNSSRRNLEQTAGVKFTRKEWNIIKRELTVKGLINPTLIGFRKWAISFWNELSPTTILIEDYRNPISYYQEYCGEEMIDCVQCEVKISKKSNRHSYCRDCWEERNKELKRKWWNNNVKK